MLALAEARVIEPAAAYLPSSETIDALHKAMCNPAVIDSGDLVPGMCTDTMVEHVDRSMTGYGSTPGLAVLKEMLNSESIRVQLGNEEFELRTYPNGQSVNELAAVFGLTPGSDVMRLAPCGQGGEIRAIHYLGHIAQKEAPQALHGGREYTDHDRRLVDHVLGWWLVPTPTLNDMAEESGKRVTAYLNNHCDETLEAAKRLTNSIDDLSGLGQHYMLREALEGELRMSRWPAHRSALKRPNPKLIYDFVAELYFDPPTPGYYEKIFSTKRQQVASEARALYRQMYRRAINFAELAERSRPDFTQGPARQAVRYITRKVALL